MYSYCIESKTNKQQNPGCPNALKFQRNSVLLNSYVTIIVFIPQNVWTEIQKFIWNSNLSVLYFIWMLWRRGLFVTISSLPTVRCCAQPRLEEGQRKWWCSAICSLPLGLSFDWSTRRVHLISPDLPSPSKAPSIGGISCYLDVFSPLRIPYSFRHTFYISSFSREKDFFKFMVVLCNQNKPQARKSLNHQRIWSVL